MIRLTVLLCAGMFAVLLIAGDDKGQVRQGLMAPPVVAEAALPAAPPAEPRAPVRAADPVATITEAVFVPTQPVRVLPETDAAQTDAAAAPVTQAAPEAAPEAAGELAVVTARSVNVRAGPSTETGVIGRLVAGEEVLVVQESGATEGWSLVRIEGDGIEGYIASRLLAPVAP